MQLKYNVKEHDYYLCEVEITIEPNKEYNITDCEIKFIPNHQDGVDFPSTWWVEIDGYFDNAKDALEESTKEKYYLTGYSEA